MTGLLSNDSKKTFGELFFRGMVAQRVGGATFDEGGSYVFSQMLNAQRELQKTAVEGDPSSTVLAFSVADPTLKIIWENFLAGIDYFKKNIDSARYTDLSGAKDLVIDDVEYENTQDALAGILNNKYPSVGRNNPITSDMVQYTYDSIKGPLSTHVPTTFFDSDSVILMPTPSYGVIAEEINRCDAKFTVFQLISLEIILISSCLHLRKRMRTHCWVNTMVLIRLRRHFPTKILLMMKRIKKSSFI